MIRRARPIWLVLAVLAIEVCLLIWDRFRLAPFSGMPGAAAVITSASVIALVLVLVTCFASALFFRTRFQFAPLSAVLLVAAAALAFGWLGMEILRCNREE